MRDRVGVYQENMRMLRGMRSVMEDSKRLLRRRPTADL